MHKCPRRPLPLCGSLSGIDFREGPAFDAKTSMGTAKSADAVLCHGACLGKREALFTIAHDRHPKEDAPGVM